MIRWMAPLAWSPPLTSVWVFGTQPLPAPSPRIRLPPALTTTPPEIVIERVQEGDGPSRAPAATRKPPGWTLRPWRTEMVEPGGTKHGPVTLTDPYVPDDRMPGWEKLPLQVADGAAAPAAAATGATAMPSSVASRARLARRASKRRMEDRNDTGASSFRRR